MKTTSPCIAWLTFCIAIIALILAITALILTSPSPAKCRFASAQRDKSESSFALACKTDGDCKDSGSDLLKNDSYARMYYELNCSYVDETEQCMKAGGYSTFDSREIPSTCQPLASGSGKTCSRESCPPMSAKYTTSDGKTYAGCTAPYNNPYPQDPASPDGKSGYLSFNAPVKSTASMYWGNMEFGYPFVAIIEGGTSEW